MFAKIRLHLFNCIRSWRIFQTLFPLSGVLLVRFLSPWKENEHIKPTDKSKFEVGQISVRR
jgi:hypothetical protein